LIYKVRQLKKFLKRVQFGEIQIEFFFLKSANFFFKIDKFFGTDIVLVKATLKSRFLKKCPAMKNIKTIFTTGLVIASVTFANACNLFNTLGNVEISDTKNATAAPVSRPSANNLEKNTNAKFIAKQLSKSTSANAVLGNTSEVLERYGYHTSSKGTFFSNSDAAVAGSPTESFAIKSMSRSERGDIVRVKVQSNKDLQVYLNTDSGLGVPFELMNLGENEVFVSPSYTLPNGNYTIRLKSKSGEVKLKLVVEQRELLGKK
jgi:hypothetical protein